MTRYLILEPLISQMLAGDYQPEPDFPRAILKAVNGYRDDLNAVYGDDPASGRDLHILDQLACAAKCHDLRTLRNLWRHLQSERKTR